VVSGHAIFDTNHPVPEHCAKSTLPQLLGYTHVVRPLHAEVGAGNVDGQPAAGVHPGFS